MNIEEIKERWNENSNSDIAMINAPHDVRYLLSIIEQAENALINIRDNAMNYSDEAEYVDIADEVLKAIRGNK